MRGVLAVAFAALLVASACDEALAPDDIAGTWVLDAAMPAQHAPVSGRLRFDRDGNVVRAVTYSVRGEPHEFVTTGRYRFRDGRLELALREGDGPARSPYSPVEYAPGVITLRYGDPADGPDIVEIYRK